MSQPSSNHFTPSTPKPTKNNCKDELPCAHPAGHRLLRSESDEGPEGRLAFRQPWLPVRIPHLCRLPWTGIGTTSTLSPSLLTFAYLFRLTLFSGFDLYPKIPGAGQLPLGRLNGSSVVLH